MVSPCKTAQAKGQNEASKAFRPLHKYVFYLEIKNSAASKLIEDRIKKFGGRVEVFLGECVTHIVSDKAQCEGAGPAPCPSPSPATTPVLASPSPVNSPTGPQLWGGGPGRRRADAMLQRAARLHPRVSATPATPVPPAPTVPVWSLHTIKQFLSRIGALAYRKVLQQPFIKFEAIDRKSRAVYKELGTWPELRLSGEHGGCPFQPPAPQHHSSTNKRMTKKAKLRIKRPVELPPKQSGYCEICRVDYAHLPDHERSAAHLSFVKNCSNFLALDSLISGSADVEAFLKMNKSAAVNNSFERRSLRNIIKLHQEDGQEPRKQLEIVCNGSSDSLPKHASPRDRRHTPQMSPALSEGKHYLRSKGGDIPCKASPGEPFGNGSVSPRLNYDKTDTNKLNGKLEEKESRQFSPVQKGKKCRSIRWRQPSPDSTPIQPETQAYYKVVGMSTKLRSSTSFAPAPPPSHRSCNGDTGTGLVVKFRRVRRSELSVLSDEAENFMFPKKDDSDTEDEVETTLSSHKRPPTDMASESSDTHPLKEEVLSGDDGSQDSCSSDFVRRNPRRRTHVESYKDNIDYFGFDIAPVRQRRRASGSPNPQHWEVEVQGAKEENTEVKDKCLKWVDGRLRASERVEGLEYTFEQVPRCEPWYEAFSRQDEGKENTRSIIRYLNTFVKPPVLPYEMGELPPLKPNCCSLSQVRKPPEPKSGPSRPYGTRGMKKRKIKQDPVFALGLNPRKSPREHASTLAILGGLHHGKRSKFSGSEDSKSLPSIAEEETSSDAGPLIVKLPPNPALEATKQVEAFLTSVDEDDEDFEISLESVKFEKTSVKPNVIELIQNYQDCLIMENTVKEINENAHPEPPKRRKGYKFKKKNKTGWPNKRKTLKKDTASTIGSVCSSRDASANREAIDTVCRLDVDASIAECASQPESAPRKNSYQLELNENSITSTSDAEDNASISSKCKATDTEHSEDDNFVCTDAVDWQCKIKDARVRNRNSLDLQPVVRVLKMEEATARRLRSAAAGRRLRTRRRPHR